MSTFSKPFFHVRAGISIAPDAPMADADRALKLGVDLFSANFTAGYAARLISGIEHLGLEINSQGVVYNDNPGSRQVARFIVKSDSGVTTDGSLPVTITAAAGNYTVPVPLRKNLHTSPAAIAAAIAEACNKAFSAAGKLEARAVGASVFFHHIYPRNHDATFSVTFPAILGVINNDFLVPVAGGVPGIITERLGYSDASELGAAYDALGATYRGGTRYSCVCSVPSGSNGFAEFSHNSSGDAGVRLNPGEFIALHKTNFSSFYLNLNPESIVDVFVLTA